MGVEGAGLREGQGGEEGENEAYLTGSSALSCAHVAFLVLLQAELSS